ncbi:MAG: transcription termination factor Rho [Verrucomicrobiales bacterium]
MRKSNEESPTAAMAKSAKKAPVKSTRTGKAADAEAPSSVEDTDEEPEAPATLVKKKAVKKKAAKKTVTKKKVAAKEKAAKKEASDITEPSPESEAVEVPMAPAVPAAVPVAPPKILELVESEDLPSTDDGRPLLVPPSGPVAADLPEIPPVPDFSKNIALDFGEPVPAPPELLHHSMRPKAESAGEPAFDPDAPVATPTSTGQVTRQSFPRDPNNPPRPQPAPSGKSPEEDDDDEEGEFEGRPGFRDRKRGKKNGLVGDPVPCSGILEISPKGFGFLRKKELCFRQTTRDVFVLPDTVRHFGLREGMLVEGEAKNGPRGPQMTDIFQVNGKHPGSHKGLPFFDELTAVNPQKRFLLETTPDKHTTRVIDMFTPVGKGQRGLIVAPPRTGKTTLLHDIAEAISTNYEDVHLILMLVDERPEEVTELSRALPNAEILASSNDNDVWAHLRIAEFGIQRAKRLVEEGRDVFILLDSITRLARAYNNAMTGKGRTMSGGVDARALEMPRRLFAAARNTREAGSLTIVGTALIETNSKADELIFQEFKGTGNMEIVLERKMAEQYVYPAVNIFKSGTRREELLLPPHQLKKIHLIRRGLAGHKPIEAMDRLLHFLRSFQSNAQMLIEIKAKGY